MARKTALKNPCIECGKHESNTRNAPGKCGFCRARAYNAYAKAAAAVRRVQAEALTTAALIEIQNWEQAKRDGNRLYSDLTIANLAGSILATRADAVEIGVLDARMHEPKPRYALKPVA